jgi:hypothetical protein
LELHVSTEPAFFDKRNFIHDAEYEELISKESTVYSKF